jgi:hypothetical protein
MRLANTQQRAGAWALAIGSHESRHVLLPDRNNPRAVHSNSTVLQSTHYMRTFELQLNCYCMPCDALLFVWAAVSLIHWYYFETGL